MRLIASQITGLHKALGGSDKVPSSTDLQVDMDSTKEDKKGRKLNKSKNNNDSSNNNNEGANNNNNNNANNNNSLGYSGNQDDRTNHLAVTAMSNGLGAIKEEEDEDGASIPPNNNNINNAAVVNIGNNNNVNVNANPKKNPQKVQAPSGSKDRLVGNVGWKPWSHIFSTNTSGINQAPPPYNAHGKYCVKLHWMVSLILQKPSLKLWLVIG